MNVVRWGMIGCGDVTERKSGPAFYKVPGSALVAVMGRRLEAVTDYAARHGITRVYTDVDALINDPEVDAVYIATPPDSHHAYSLKVAAAGKHCCVEKPMALNAGQSREMQQAFAEAGLHLFVAYYRRSLPRFAQVRQWLEEGRIGDVRHLSWTLTKAPSPADLDGRDNWRTDPAVAGGGYFADLASHGFDLFQYLLGDIVDIAGFTARQAGLYAAEDAVSASWRFASGALAWAAGALSRIDVRIGSRSSAALGGSVFRCLMNIRCSCRPMNTSAWKSPITSTFSGITCWA